MTGWAPDPDAEELARLDREIGVLGERFKQAEDAYRAAESALRAALQRRQVAAAWMRATAMAGASTPPAPPAGATEPVSPTSSSEASTRTVQNVLFVLGGLLLGTAAVVFTAVAWARYGVMGRAVILAVVTAMALVAPPIALWRRLTATAETFAAVGLLLVVLDGYAAYFVNFLGVQDMPGTRYAGLVAGVTAAVAAGYRALTRLAGPGFVALVVAQPAPPLLVAGLGPDTAGWALVFSGVAVVDLMVVLWWRRRTDGVARAMRATAWGLCAAALTASTCVAIVAEVLANTPREAALAGISVVAAGALLVCAALITRSDPFLGVSTSLLVLTVVAGAGRFAAVVWPRHTLVLAAAVIAVVAVMVAVLRALAGRTPSPGPRTDALRSGARAGGLVAAGALTTVLVARTLIVAVETLGDALPIWSADLVSNGFAYDWQLVAAVALATCGFLAVLPRSAWPGTVAIGGATAVLAVPGSFALPWWAPSTVDLAVAGVLTVVAVLAGKARPAQVAAVASAVLTAHAIPASLARAEHTAAVLGALVVLGAMVGIVAGSTVEDCQAHRRAIGGFALFLSLFATPPAVGAVLVAAEVVPWWVARLTTAAVVLCLGGLFAVRRWWPALTWNAFAAVVASAVIWTTVPVLMVRGESVAVYEAVGLLAITAALLPMRRHPAAGSLGAAAAVPGAMMLAVDVLPGVWAVFLAPYLWLRAVWSGAPEGPGLMPAGMGWYSGAEWDAEGVDAAALAVLAVAAGVAVYAVKRNPRTATGGLLVGGPAAVLLGLAAADAAWPTVQAVSLVLGLVLVILAAIAVVPHPAAVLAAGQGVALTGAGLAGSLPTKWATLGALGLTVVAFAAVGAAGRTLGARIAGWMTAVAAALTTAMAATAAADLPLRIAALVVLAVAALVLAAGAALGQRRGSEALAMQGGAHAGALVAVLLALGSIRYAAAVCTLWGLAVGLRALWPHTRRASRAALAAVAAGWELLAWWLLLDEQEVALVEAYTLPLAGVALVAGWAALRARPDLRSWVAYGPALCAAFLPSLATVLFTEGEPVRRLLLGTGALAVVVVGSMWRRQAPVVIGGSVLSLVALHELVLVWDRLPRFIPLAIGGLILVGLAMTYERRRRDLARLREAVGRMR